VEILLRHVAVAKLAPRGRPVVAIHGLQPPERFTHLVGLEADKRVSVPICSRLRFGLQLFERSAALRVAEADDK
jgi:hypothetical protein